MDANCKNLQKLIAHTSIYQQYMAALPAPGVILSTGLYPGEVQSQQGNSYEVSTIAKSGGYGNSEEGQHLTHKRYN